MEVPHSPSGEEEEVHPNQSSLLAWGSHTTISRGQFFPLPLLVPLPEEEIANLTLPPQDPQGNQPINKDVPETTDPADPQALLMTLVHQT